jgi:hypothetical protein
MQRLGTILVLVGLGAGLGLACSDRKTPDVDEEALRLCEANCDRYEDCDVLMKQATHDECVDECVGYDWIWRQGCREESKTLWSCTNELSCNEFAITVAPETTNPERSCGEQRTEWSICLAHDANVDGG